MSSIEFLRPTTITIHGKFSTNSCSNLLYLHGLNFNTNRFSFLQQKPNCFFSDSITSTLKSVAGVGSRERLNLYGRGNSDSKSSSSEKNESEGGQGVRQKQNPTNSGSSTSQRGEKSGRSGLWWSKGKKWQWQPIVQAQEIGVLLLQLGIVMFVMRLLRPGIPLPGSEPRTPTTFVSVPYRSVESEIGKFQESESLLMSVGSTRRIVHTTTRPSDIKTPYEKMLENDVEFGSPDKRSGGFLNSALIALFYVAVLVGLLHRFPVNFSQHTARQIRNHKSRGSGGSKVSEQGETITFADVAGVDEAKEELEEIVVYTTWCSSSPRSFAGGSSWDRRRLARLKPRAEATGGVRIMCFASPQPSEVFSSSPRSPHASGCEKAVVARHEAGHAVAGTAVANLLGGQPRVEKLSILPRSGGALGFTYTPPTNEDRYLLFIDELRGRLVTLFGGRAAEEVVYSGRVSTGALDDIRRATDMAFKAVAEYGLNQTVGPLSLATLSGGGMDESGGAGPWGRDQGQLIDLVQREVKALLQSAHEVTLSVLRANPTVLEGLGAHLEENEKVEGEELQDWLKLVVVPKELIIFVEGKQESLLPIQAVSG
ncbi:FTSH protease 9 [Hibiscus trionum]|uniref:FTSH protease 9 n=1 Tax=Hibiscus trionum TaxID=183268 RepID=A0A9W7JDD3_HIBTR|nr:FTSH protease 9 [Hibiscus trionum]